jgi:hypothetical protein
MKYREYNGKFYSKDDNGNVSQITVEQYSNAVQAQETGVGESMLVGAGKVLSNVPFLTQALEAIPGNPLGVQSNIEDTGAYRALQAERPYSTAAGEIIPSMVGPVRAGLAGQALYGGLQGAAMSEDRVMGGALGAGGAAIGDMAGRVLGKIMNVFDNTATPGTRVARELSESGYQLTPAQKSGKQGAMKLERGLEKTPQGQQIVSEMGEANQDLLLTRANEAIGQPAAPTPLTRDTLDVAADEIGERMQLAVADTDLQISEELGKRISRIVKNDDMLELPEIPDGGWLRGEDYMRVRSGLTDAQRAAQGPARNYIKKTIDQIDEEFLAVAGPEQAAAYRQAREHYKNLIQLEKGHALSSDGLVNYKTAGNAFRSKTGYGKRGIDNALPETQALIRDIDNLSGQAVNPMIGNSGTPEGLMDPFSWKARLRGIGAEQYYKRGGMLGGLMQPSPQAPPAIGAAVGRSGAGLLAD